jgi:O-antigen/teichoic acid export membrane protein
MSGLTIARIPLFAFAAVQLVLLPRLTRQLARGEHRSFRAQLRLVVAATAGLGLAGVLGAALLGPEVLRLLFGPRFALPRADLVWLAGSSAVYMLALTFQPAVIALGRHRGNALAWVAGLGAFLVALVPPGDLFHRVEVALTLGGLVAAAVLAWRALAAPGSSADLDLAVDPAAGRLGME